MLPLSNLTDLIPPSATRKLVPFAECAKARGTKIYHLNIGEPDVEPPLVAMDALHGFKSKVIGYTHSAGIETYRRRLAEFYNRRNFGLDFSNIMVTAGGSEALLFAMMTICNKGDQIIVPEPFYANYNGIASLVGAEIVTIKSSIESGFALPPVTEFEKYITPKTKAILVCNPNNPTGYLYTKSEMEQLRDLVQKHNLFFLADEVYSDFCYDGKEHYSVMNLKGIDENVILIDSVSKRYSMCGVRIGALITKNKAVLGAVLKMCQARLCAPMVGQVMADAAIDTPDSYFESVNKEFTDRRNFMVGELQKMKGVVCPMPSGAFYAMAALPVDNAEKFSQWLLEEFSYEGATVMLTPATGFYNDSMTCPQNEVRIAYVLKIEDLKQAMIILEKALAEYNMR